MIKMMNLQIRVDVHKVVNNICHMTNHELIG